MNKLVRNGRHDQEAGFGRGNIKVGSLSRETQ